MLTEGFALPLKDEDLPEFLTDCKSELPNESFRLNRWNR